MKIYKVFETIPYNVTGTELYYQNIDEAKDKLLELTLNYLDYILDTLSVKKEERKKLEITLIKNHSFLIGEVENI